MFSIHTNTKVLFWALLTMFFLHVKIQNWRYEAHPKIHYVSLNSGISDTMHIHYNESGSTAHE